MAHDVVVLGATIAGLTTARRLAAGGYDVVVLDPHEEARTAAVGHGVAAIGHASTVANMAHAYGMEAAREHLRRNLAAMAEIRETLPDARTLRLRDGSLPGGDERETREVTNLLVEAGARARVLVAPDGAAVVSECIVVDPLTYARALLDSARDAGAEVRHHVTVTRLTRHAGVSGVWVRDSLAWERGVDALRAIAVVDTLGVSPWGRAARIGPEQFVPAVRGVPHRGVRDVSLSAEGPAWMTRPVGDEVLILGRKATGAAIGRLTDELFGWAQERLGLTDAEPGRLIIDPSDNGRPVVGASAIPGGFYARGNGRGELANGTASGYYLWQLLTTRPDLSVGLPPLSRIRAKTLGRWL